MISICCVSYNDLDYLKILYDSIKRNTKIKYEFIVHCNGSVDGTEEWLKKNNIIYTVTQRNEGNPALNYAVEKAKYDYIFLPNADNYLLPNWDVDLVKNINNFKFKGIEKFIIGFTLIEPMGNNPEYLIHYCGHDSFTFNEDELLRFYFNEAQKYSKIDTIQYSFPNCLPKKLWDEFGGMDFDYWPGFSCDHDFAARAYKFGCRNFKLLGRPRVYHFSSGTYRKMEKSDRMLDGQNTFLKKWGITVDEFRRRLGVAHSFCIVQDNIF